jgi:hypothetical protein
MQISTSVGGDHESARPQLDQGFEHGIKVSLSTGVQDMEPHPQGARRRLQVCQL